MKSAIEPATNRGPERCGRAGEVLRAAGSPREPRRQASSTRIAKAAPAAPPQKAGHAAMNSPSTGTMAPTKKP